MATFGPFATISGTMHGPRWSRLSFKHPFYIGNQYCFTKVCPAIDIWGWRLSRWPILGHFWPCPVQGLRWSRRCLNRPFYIRNLGRVHKRAFIYPYLCSIAPWNKPNFAPHKSNAWEFLWRRMCESSPRQHQWRDSHLLSIGASVHIKLSCSLLLILYSCRARHYLSFHLMKI